MAELFYTAEVSDTTGAGFCFKAGKKYQLLFFNVSPLRRNPFNGSAGGSIFLLTAMVCHNNPMPFNFTHYQAIMPAGISNTSF